MRCLFRPRVGSVTIGDLSLALSEARIFGTNEVKKGCLLPFSGKKNRTPDLGFGLHYLECDRLLIAGLP